MLRKLILLVLVAAVLVSGGLAMYANVASSDPPSSDLGPHLQRNPDGTVNFADEKIPIVDQDGNVVGRVDLEKARRDGAGPCDAERCPEYVEPAQ